jgi:hypothetical protein
MKNKECDHLAQDLFGQLQRQHEEIIFPASFIDPVGEVAVKRHD